MIFPRIFLLFHNAIWKLALLTVERKNDIQIIVELWCLEQFTNYDRKRGSKFNRLIFKTNIRMCSGTNWCIATITFDNKLALISLVCILPWQSDIATNNALPNRYISQLMAVLFNYQFELSYFSSRLRT